MSRLAHHLRLYPPGTIVTKAMMQDHQDMQKLLDKQYTQQRQQARRDAQAARQADEDAHILKLAEYHDPYGN